jgi:hypothetical protein
VGESGKKKHDFPRCKKTHPDKKAEVGCGLFQFCCGHARGGRNFYAVRAKDEGHPLGQIGREQGAYIVVERGIGHVGQRGGQAKDLGVSPAEAGELFIR